MPKKASSGKAKARRAFKTVVKRNVPLQEQAIKKFKAKHGHKPGRSFDDWKEVNKIRGRLYRAKY